MKSSPSIFLLLLLCIAMVAQSVLTNDSIIKMSKAGLSDDIIISTLGSQPVKFSTSADDLIALKKAGVSDKVIAAVMTKGSAPAASTPASVAPTTAATAVGARPDLVPVARNKIAPRTYTITLPTLGPGEYGFLPPASSDPTASSGRIGKIYSFRLIE